MLHWNTSVNLLHVGQSKNNNDTYLQIPDIKLSNGHGSFLIAFSLALQIIFSAQTLMVFLIVNGWYKLNTPKYNVLTGILPFSGDCICNLVFLHCNLIQ